MLHKSLISRGDDVALSSSLAERSMAGSTPNVPDLRTNSHSFVRHDGAVSGLPSARSEIPNVDAQISLNLFADSLMSQLFHNLAVLKVRVLHCSGAALSPVELDVVEKGQEVDTRRLSSLEESLRLMRDEMAMKRKQVASVAMGSRSARMMSSQSAFDDDDIELSEKPVDPQEVVRHVVAEHLNGFFKNVMDELSLRLAATTERERSRLAPRARLEKAIAHQAGEMDKAAANANSTRTAMAILHKKVDELQGTLKRREEYHRQQLDGFLREVCVLKEQLYRSYRDKDYIAKEVDLMQTLEDVDTGEDVSVDTLFQYRKQVRVADKMVMDAQSRLRRMEEELAEKEQLVAREAHRQRAREASSSAMKLEMGELNLRCLQQEETIRALQHSLSVARGDYEPAVFADAEVQTASLEDEEIFRTPFASEKANAARGLGKLALIRLVDTLAEKEKALHRQLQSAEADWEKKSEELLREHEATLSKAQQERDDALHERDEVLTNSREAIEISKRSKEEVESIRSLAIRQADSLVSELLSSQQQVDALRVKGISVCRAFLGLQVRFEALKTRQGVSDYKRRANAFHFQRAQTAVDCAREQIASVRNQCISQLEAAAQMIRDSKSAESKMRVQLADQEEEHRAGVAMIQERVTTMEKASRILLQDYERLRNEFVSRAANSPAQSRVASANGNRRPTSGKAPAPLPPVDASPSEGSASAAAAMHRTLDTLISSQRPEVSPGVEATVQRAEGVISELIVNLLEIVGSAKGSHPKMSSAALREAEAWGRLRKLLSSHNQLQAALSQLGSISRGSMSE